jgi:hypothetical protein
MGPLPSNLNFSGRNLQKSWNIFSICIELIRFSLAKIRKRLTTIKPFFKESTLWLSEGF